MATSIYHINKGINRPLEFRGLRAQYIGYLAAGLVALLLLFTFLYLVGAPLLLCLVTVLGGGGALFWGVYFLNRTYGRYGLLKKVAGYQVPACLRVTSRQAFLRLAAKRPADGRAH